MIRRYELSQSQWERVASLLPGKVGDPGRHAAGNRCQSPPAGHDGQKGGDKNQALGRCRGGLTTKIHLLCDALGRALRLRLTPGQAAEIKSAPALLAGVRAKGAIADRADDANALRALRAALGMEAVIPAKRHRKLPIAHAAALYRTRHRIERCFNRLKALSAHRHPLPPARRLLPELAPPRLHLVLAALNVDSA